MNLSIALPIAIALPNSIHTTGDKWRMTGVAGSPVVKAIVSPSSAMSTAADVTKTITAQIPDMGVRSDSLRIPATEDLADMDDKRIQTISLADTAAAVAAKTGPTARAGSKVVAGRVLWRWRTWRRTRSTRTSRVDGEERTQYGAGGGREREYGQEDELEGYGHRQYGDKPEEGDGYGSRY